MTDLTPGALRGHDEEPDDPISDAAIYARTSSVNQRHGYSLDEQVRQCVQRCEMYDWDVRYVFQDQAESGKNPERPQFQLMLDCAEEEEFDVLVFWKLDRFSRSIMHAVQLESQFREDGIALHSVTEQIDTTSAAGRFNFRNIANAAEFERDLIKQRTRMGHIALAQEEKWPNDSPPLGYEKTEEGRLEPLPREAELVETIFDRYIELQSMPQVAQVVNEGGTQFEGREDWSGRSVGKVLRNRIYIGEYEVGDIQKQVPDYQLIPKSKFDTATEVRYRFQEKESASRGAMEEDRKEAMVGNVTSSYREFLRKDGGK